MIDDSAQTTADIRKPQEQERLAFALGQAAFNYSLWQPFQPIEKGGKGRNYRR